MIKENIFGERIKLRLSALDQTQRWLGKETGIPHQVISNLINGRFANSGNITQAVPIAKALNTTVDYLFGITANPERPIWPSARVRRLATLAELLPDADIDRLIAEAQARVRVSRQQLWQSDLVAAVEALVQRHGGDIEETLRQLDKLVNDAEDKGAKPSADSTSPAPSLFDECQK